MERVNKRNELWSSKLSLIFRKSTDMKGKRKNCLEKKIQMTRFPADWTIFSLHYLGKERDLAHWIIEAPYFELTDLRNNTISKERN